METKTVQPENVHVSEYNERQEELEDDELEELTKSVSKVGVANPVVLRNSIDDSDVDEEYEVIIGQRRVAAAQKAELFSIPAVVVEWSDEDALAASITENIETLDQNVSTKDRAEALSKLWDEMDGEGKPDVSELSSRLGVTESTVRRWLEPLRGEWEGTPLDPDNEESTDGEVDTDDESVEDETDESVDSDGDDADDTDNDVDDDQGTIEDQWDDEVGDDEDVNGDDEEVQTNPDERPDDAHEFDDDPIDEVGNIDVNDERPAESDDDSDYDGPDGYTDGADTAPGLNTDEEGPGAGKLEDPEERDTEVPEPEDIDTDNNGGGDDEPSMDDLRPELADLSPDKIASVRRMTGGGEAGIEALEQVKEYGLSNQQVREAASRVKNGTDVDVALESVATDSKEEGPRVRVQFTISGEVAEVAQERAKERSTSVNEVANDALHQVLFPDDTEPEKLFNED